MKVYWGDGWETDVDDEVWQEWLDKREYFPDDFERDAAVNAVREYNGCDLVKSLLKFYPDIPEQFMSEDLWEFFSPGNAKDMFGNSGWFEIKSGEYSLPYMFDVYKIPSRNNKHSNPVMGGCVLKYFVIAVARNKRSARACGKYPFSFACSDSEYPKLFHYHVELIKDNTPEED